MQYYWVGCLGMCLFLSSGLCAQELLWERIGLIDRTLIAQGALNPAGDVNGDGWEDLFTVVKTFDSEGLSPQVWLLSGVDGSTLKVLRPEHAENRMSEPTDVGDVDGDGVRDYAITNSHIWRLKPDSVTIRSGRDDSILWRALVPAGNRFGRATLGDIDLNGDGRLDVVIAAPDYSLVNNTLVGAVRAFDHLGQPLYELSGNDQGLQIGLALGRLYGDLDRDGIEDYIIGTNGYPPHGYGQAMVVSGATGHTLVTGLDTQIQNNIGEHVTGVGDLDADGVPDFAANGGGLSPIPRVFSGRTGGILHRWLINGLGQGAISSRGHDLDRDGLADLVLGAPFLRTSSFLPGAILALSGRDASIMFQINVDPQALSPLSGLGYWLTTLAPPPGSPFPLFAVAQPGFGGAGGRFFAEGRIALYRSSPPGVQAFGQGCQGPSAAATPRLGILDLGGQAVRLHLSGASAGPAVLCLGLSNAQIGSLPLPLALGPYGQPGCSLLTSSDWLVPTTVPGRGSAAGYAFLDLPLPLRQPGSITLYGQWAVQGTSGTDWGWSDGLSWQH